MQPVAEHLQEFAEQLEKQFAVTPLALQVVGVRSDLRSVERTTWARDRALLEGYIRAAKVYTGEEADARRIRRSLLRIQPPNNKNPFVARIPERTTLRFPAADEIALEIDPRQLDTSSARGVVYWDALGEADIIFQKQANERCPRGRKDQTYFQHCLAKYVEPPGWFVWLEQWTNVAFVGPQRGQGAKAALFAVVTAPTAPSPVVRYAFRQTLQLISSDIYVTAVRDHARRSAVAAVMARNMSHNIGSHVLARLSAPTDLAQQSDGLASVTAKVASFNSYLRTRMDFLADVATAGYATTVTRPVRDIVKLLFDQNQGQDLLLDRISGTNLNRAKITSNWRELQATAAAIPNDMLGAHALYVIIENVVRNCAKHDGVSALNLKFTIEDDKKYPDLIKVNISRPVNGRKYTDVARGINNSLQRGILDSDGGLRKDDWGLMEMKVAAGYLRGVPPEDVDAAREPILLAASAASKMFGYTLYLLRAREVLLVNCRNNPIVAGAMKSRDKLRSTGVEILTGNVDHYLKGYYPNSFAVLIDPTPGMIARIKIEKCSFPWRIFVCCTGAEDTDRQLTDPDAPLELEPLELQLLLQKGGEALLAALWERWVARRYPETRNIGLVKLDERGQPFLKTLKPTGGSDTPLLQLEPESGILFDNHGDANAHDLGVRRYYDPYPSAGLTGWLFQSLERNPVRGRLINELIESALLRVAIVDERLQEAIEGKEGKGVPTYNSIPMPDIVRGMNIFVPPISKINLAASELGESSIEGDAQRTVLNKWIQQQLSVLDFLVIHLGIIEKLQKGTARHNIALWIEKIETLHPSLKIVVISGRGTPPNLPAGVRFMNYSTVSRYVVEDRSKISLCRVLSASRRST